jgi:hypothetical protein
MMALRPAQGGGRAEPATSWWPRILLVASLALGGLAGVPGCSSATTGQPPPSPTAMPGSLQWGVIPVGAGARAAAKLLRELAGSHRLLVHVYYDWTDADAGSASWARSALSSAEPYCRLGFPAELAVRYRSEQGNYLAYTQAVGRLAALATQSSCVVSLQVTNEANFALSKPTSDGAYPSAELALVKGVEASKAQVEAGRGSLRVGFNLAYLPTFSSVPAFLASLNAAGGASFVGSLDFVGLDLYPGTYYPALPPPGSPGFSDYARQLTSQELLSFHSQLFGELPLRPSTKLELTEIGFPTSQSWHHTDAEQAELVDAFAAGACAVSSQTGLSSFEWFDLADAAAPSPDLSPLGLSLPWQFGLVRHDLRPKPAFFAYQRVIGRRCPS